MGKDQNVCVIAAAEDRARLAAVVGESSRPLKHEQRARIVLLSAKRLPVLAVARRAGVSRPTPINLEICGSPAWPRHRDQPDGRHDRGIRLWNLFVR